MKFDFDLPESENYAINMGQVLNSESVYPVVKNFAKLYAEKGYIAPGDYFANVPTSDLLALRDMAEGSRNGVFEDEENMVLLAMMMTNAEGIDVTENMFERMFASLAMFISLEYLDRNNLAVAIRKNFTFDPDSDEIIARKI